MKSRRRMLNRLILILILLATGMAALFYSCSRSDTPGDAEEKMKRRVQRRSFVGAETCASCHQQAMQSWKGSHHDWAMAEADSVSVRADFSGTTFRQEGRTYRFFRKGDQYFVEAPGPKGNRKTYEVTHTFGWTPLQQYLVDFGNGKLQALQVAWDTRRNRWFSMHPDQKVGPGDWLHWTGGAMNWNTMCADCHSTQLEQNYIPQSDSFHTTWTSIDVSCEACHGPGREHVEFMRSKASKGASLERIRSDLDLTGASTQKQQINKCARCHALREKLVDKYDHSKTFMDHYNPNLPHPEMYFADGQIKEEVYVYGSFLQSQMFQEGIKCNDCHNPHSLKLKANVKDNTLCMNCHKPKYNTPEHHHHEPNTKASRCINCHMTGRTYMEVNFRRDHSFRIPRPDQSAKFGTPNACNKCHSQKSAKWAAEAVRQWYGPQRPDHYSSALLKADSMGVKAESDLRELITDTTAPDIARATAVWYLGQFPGSRNVDLLKKALHDPNPLLRKSAARALGKLPMSKKKPILSDALDDSVRAVRIAAIEGLLNLSAGDFVPGIKHSFKTSIKEYKSYLDVNRYFPNGLLNRGQFYEKQGKIQKAIQAYKKALQKDPRFNPARINLAYLYNQRGNNKRAQQLLEEVIRQQPKYGPAYFSLALVMAERGNLKAAIPKLKRAAELMPDHARVRYNLAIIYQKTGQIEKAEKRYKQAIQRAPENQEFIYGISTLYLQQKEYRKALPYVRKLTEIAPQNRRYQRLLNLIKTNI